MESRLAVELLEDRTLLSVAAPAPAAPLVNQVTAVPPPSTQDSTPGDAGEIYIFGDGTQSPDTPTTSGTGSSADSTDEYPLPPPGTASQQVLVQLQAPTESVLLPLRETPADVVAAFHAIADSSAKGPVAEAKPGMVAADPQAISMASAPLAGRSTALDLAFSLNLPSRILDVSTDAPRGPTSLTTPVLAALPDLNEGLSLPFPETPASAAWTAESGATGPSSAPTLWTGGATHEEAVPLSTADRDESVLPPTPEAVAADNNEIVQAMPAEPAPAQPHSDWLSASLMLCSLVALAHWHPYGTIWANRRAEERLNLEAAPPKE
jgi:hypothetical protein